MCKATKKCCCWHMIFRIFFLGVVIWQIHDTKNVTPQKMPGIVWYEPSPPCLIGLAFAQASNVTTKWSFPLIRKGTVVCVKVFIYPSISWLARTVGCVAVISSLFCDTQRVCNGACFFFGAETPLQSGEQALVARDLRTAYVEYHPQSFFYFWFLIPMHVRSSCHAYF